MGRNSQVFFIQAAESILTGFALNFAFIAACKLLYNAYFPIGKANQIILCLVVTCIGMMALALGKYFSIREKAFPVMISRVLAVIASLDFVFVSLLYFSLAVRLSPYLFILTNVMQITLLLLLKALFRRYKGELCEDDRVLVMGANDTDGQVLMSALGRDVKKFMFMRLDKDFGELPEGLPDSSDFDGKLANSIHAADVIYLSDGLSKAQKDRIISYCIFKEKNVYLVPETYEIALRKSELTQVGDVPVFNISSFRLTQMQLFMKRILDIIGSLMGLLLSCPIWIPAMILIRREDGGPVFFRQTRAGQGGREFKVIKLRTMVPDAEKHTGAVLAKADDPRVTRIGKKLRAMRIDEIPQFLNVLKGEMSLVGPRPERPVFVKEFSENLPEYASRLKVKPGITGLAQVMGHYTTTAANKAKFDLVYIRNYSFWLDIKILLKTVGVVFAKERAQGVRAETATGNANETTARDDTVTAGETEQVGTVGDFGVGQTVSGLPWQIGKPEKKKRRLLYRFFRTTAATLCILVILSGIVVLRYSNLLLNVMAEEAREVSMAASETVQGDMADGASGNIPGGASGSSSGGIVGNVSGSSSGNIPGVDAQNNAVATVSMQTGGAAVPADGAGTALEGQNTNRGLTGQNTSAVQRLSNTANSEYADWQTDWYLAAMATVPADSSGSDSQKSEETAPMQFSSKVNVIYKVITNISTEDILIIEKMSEGGFTEMEKEAVRQILANYFTEEEMEHVLEIYRQVTR